MNKTIILVALLAVLASSHTFSENTKVLQLTVDNFSSVTGVGNGRVLKNTIGMFYAPWCGHCKHLIPIYEQLAAAVPSVNVVAVDCTQNQPICTGFEVKGYPTVLFFTTEGKQIPYEQARTVEALSSFVTEGYKKETGTDITFSLPSPIVLAAQNVWRQIQIQVNSLQSKVGGPVPFYGGVAAVVVVLILLLLLLCKKQVKSTTTENSSTSQPKEAKKRD